MNKKERMINALKEALSDVKEMEDSDEPIVCIIQYQEKDDLYRIDHHIIK